MASLCFGKNRETFDSLLAAYGEKHRHYHNAAHIDACLNWFDKARPFAEKPDDVELAIWFHDAVYRPMRSDNESASAQWAKTFLLENFASDTRVKHVYDLIISTLHNTPADRPDKILLVDIDLSILGSPPEVYDQFERAIRWEYKWIPYFLYRKRRKEILNGFFSRESVYSHPYFRNKLERRARLNLERAINKL